MFGKLLSTEEGETPSGGGGGPSEPTAPGAEEDSDLRQHMVSILFSRCKLTHLQTQVRGAAHLLSCGRCSPSPHLSREQTSSRDANC